MASIVITPDSGTLEVGDTVALTAATHDAGGRVVHVDIAWATSDSLVLTIDSAGKAVARAVGGAWVYAAVGEVVDSVPISVLVPVTSIAIVPSALTIVPGGAFRFRALPFAANGDSLPGRPLSWTSSDTLIASIAASGTAAGRTPGTVTVSVTSGHITTIASLAVRTVTFTTIDAAEYAHACAITTDSVAFCWGEPTSVGVGVDDSSGTPVKVASNENFALMTGGDSFSCGVTTAGVAYCWGWNVSGRLGAGSSDREILLPVPVAGNHVFSAIAAGHRHACAITTAGEAWCWGSGTGHGLGAGPSVDQSSTPVLVSGGLEFRSISSAGVGSTCALATDSTAYCWGINADGQAGTGDTASSAFVPTPIAGGLKFREVSAGGWHSCGIATTGAAYCWGSNAEGQLGNGDSVSSRIPVPVAGGLTFAHILAGGGEYSNRNFTCGLTSAGDAYCWGDNTTGMLGDGTTVGHPLPAPVNGGIHFSVLSLGGSHACGVSTDHVAYCWGWNGWGELGTGLGEFSYQPTRVMGQP